jgi:predicted dehydrogenase
LDVAVDHTDTGVNVAIIGLGFGAEFIPIYQRIPMRICTRSASARDRKLHEIGDAFGIEKRYTRLRGRAGGPQVDFVHINTPIPDHAPHVDRRAQGRQARHACTVPMATTIADCRGDRRAGRPRPG